MRFQFPSASWEKPSWVRNWILAFSATRPRLVVITTTPLDARAPYMEVEVASLRTEIDCISLGLMALKSLAEIGRPSRMNRGAVPALMELVPRIWNDAVALGSPELESTIKPVAFP